jgi:hypothetical protein
VFEAEQVIAGMLAREVVIFRIEQHAGFAAWIICHRRAELRAVRAPHNERAYGVGAEIEAEREHGSSHQA